MRCFQFEALFFALWSLLCTRRCRQDCTKHRGGKHQLDCDCEQLQIITAQSLCIRITRIDNIWLKLSHSIQDFSMSFTNLRIIYLNSLNENVRTMIFLDAHCVIFLSNIQFTSTEEFQKRRNTEKGKSRHQSYDAGSREICHSSWPSGAIAMAGGYLTSFNQFLVKYKITAD